MAVSFVKAATNTSTTGTSISGTFASATTAGNLVFFVVGVDKSGGAFSNTGGWTVEHNLPSTSVSLYMGWQVSTGQTTFTVNWTTSTAGASLWMGEYTDSAVPTGTWTQLSKASTITTEASVTSTSTGTTGTLSADGMAVAGAAIDTAANFTSPAWSNSYVSRYTGNVGSSRGGALAAEKAVTSGTTTSSTVSWTTADQASAAVVVLYKAASGTSYDKTPADTVGVTDSATVAQSWSVTVADTVGVTDAASAPGAVQSWTAENGTQGAALTSTSVPYSQAATNGAGCSQVFDNAHVAEGSLAYKYHAESALQATGRVALTTTNLTYSIRFAFWASTTGQRQIFAVRHSAGNVLRFRYDGTNVAWANSANGAVVTATESLPSGSFYEVELRLKVGADTATGEYQIDLFDLGGSTPLNATTYTSTTYNLGTAAISHLDFGINDSAAFVTDLWLDLIRAQPGTMVGLGPSTTGTDYTGTPADSVAVADTVTLAADRTASDAVGVTDAATTASGFAATLADSVAASDAVTTAADNTRTTTDPIGVTDAATSALDANRGPADTATVTDTVTLEQHVQRTIPDAVTVTDAASPTFQGAASQNISDTAGITDTLDVTASRNVAIADIAAVADAAQAGIDRATAIAEQVGVTDHLALDRTAALAEELTVVDAAAHAASAQGELQDAAPVTDLVTVTRTVTVTDLVGVTDQATRSGGLMRDITITATLTATRLASVITTTRTAAGLHEPAAAAALADRTLSATFTARRSSAELPP